MRGPAVLATSVAVGLCLLSPSPVEGQEPVLETAGLVRVRVTPNPFSPNGDGRKDRATIRIESAVPATIRVRVLDHRGTARRAWVRRSEGAHRPLAIRWKGRAGSRRLRDGTYTIRAVATPHPGVSGDVPRVTRGEARVIVDTRAPAIYRARVSPTRLANGGDLTMRFTARDRAREMAARILVLEAVGRLDRIEHEVERGTTRIGWQAPRRLYPGNYRMALRVEDDAGNIRRRVLRWRVERRATPRVFRRLSAGRRVALTFDDCHRPGAWARILGVLHRANVRATFFCPGTMVHAFPDLARRTVNQGHTPGSHAWDHASLAGRGAAFTGGRLRSDARAWWTVARATSAPYVRPPYGAYDAGVLRGAGASWHPRVIMWDVDPLDWMAPGASAIASRVLSAARPGSIVLLHTMEQTADALPTIISGLRARGLRPVTLPVLFRASGRA